MAVVVCAYSFVAQWQWHSPHAVAIGSTGNGSGAPYTLTTYASDEAESKGVAERVRDLPRTNRHSIAVLARTKAQLIPIKQHLNTYGVPCFIAQRRDEFESTEFQFIDAALHASLARSDRRYLRGIVKAFSSLTNTRINEEEIVATAAASHGDLFRAWCDTILKSKSTLAQDNIELARTTKSTLVESSCYEDFAQYAMKIFQCCHFTDSKGARFAAIESDTQAWDSLVREIRSTSGGMPPLDVFLHELELRSKEPPPPSDAVGLMTIHGAKGNEFHTVFLVGMAEEILPSWHSLKKGSNSIEVEEERRNCFVAITRTETQLHLSFASTYRGWAKRPSRFLQDMGVL